MKKKVLSIILLFVPFLGVTQAQVTIGSNIEPVNGSLLDIKEWNVNDGSSNAKRGIVFPRVALTNENELFPMFIGNETDYVTYKKTHTGMLVYNTNIVFPFTEDLYFWNGTKWINNSTIPLTANNGLSIDNNTIQLGGDLLKSTTLGLLDKNLNITTTAGAIGINEANPKAYLHINPPTDNDPIIIKSVKDITEPMNASEAGNSIYYDLQISSGGVLRKVQPVTSDLNVSSFYNLSNDLAVQNGLADGTGGSFFSWNKTGVVGNFTDIELPQDGAYVFSFRLYGTTGGSSGQAASYYISAFKDSGTGFQLFDIAEMMILRLDKAAATYSINLSVSGKQKEKVRFKISMLNSSTVTWTLKANASSTAANRTSMIFWRL